MEDDTVVQRTAVEDDTVVQRTAVEDDTVVQRTAVEDNTVVQRTAVEDCTFVHRTAAESCTIVQRTTIEDVQLYREQMWRTVQFKSITKLAVHQIMKRPNATHCGESFSREAVSSSSSSGWMGASFRTVVSRFTWGIVVLLKVTCHKIFLF